MNIPFSCSYRQRSLEGPAYVHVKTSRLTTSSTFLPPSSATQNTICTTIPLSKQPSARTILLFSQILGFIPSFAVGFYLSTPDIELFCRSKLINLTDRSTKETKEQSNTQSLWLILRRTVLRLLCLAMMSIFWSPVSTMQLAVPSA